MNAGLPGLGISGIFFIISALLMPLFKLLKGRFANYSWKLVMIQFLMTIIIIVSAVATNLYAYYLYKVHFRTPAVHQPLAGDRYDYGLLIPIIILAVVSLIVFGCGIVLRKLNPLRSELTQESARQ